MMTPSEYQKAALRTASAGAVTELHLGLANWGLGLAGEAGEVLELFTDFEDGVKFTKEQLSKEIGDVLWYAAMLCEQTGLDLGRLAFPTHFVPTEATHLTITATRITDYIKKVVCQGHDLDVQHLEEDLSLLLHVANGLCRAHGLTLTAVMEANIKKLKDRYPEGFSTEASLNRSEV